MGLVAWLTDMWEFKSYEFINVEAQKTQVSAGKISKVICALSWLWTERTLL